MLQILPKCFINRAAMTEVAKKAQVSETEEYHVLVLSRGASGKGIKHTSHLTSLSITWRLVL